MLGSKSILQELCTELEKTYWETKAIQINATRKVHPDQNFFRSMCIRITPEGLFQQVAPASVIVKDPQVTLKCIPH